MKTETRLWIIAGVIGLGVLLYLLGPILTPFIISALLAWLGDPIADKLETWRFPRALAVGVVFLGTFIIIALLVLLIAPMVGREVTELSARGPQFFTWYDKVVTPWLSLHLHIDENRLRIDNLSAMLTGNSDTVGQFLTNTFTTLSHSGRILFTVVITVLLVPVITFYWLRDWDIFKARMSSLLPRDQAPAVAAVLHDCETVLAAFFRGQLLVMVALACIYSIGLSIAGLQGGLAIGIIAGLLSFVPYLGITTGVILALMAAVLQTGGSDWLPLYVVIVFSIGQALESFVLTPRLVGGRIGLHPVLVIFAILAGGKLFGFVGVLLALPVAAACTVLIRHAHAHYLDSQLYRGDGGNIP
ncbi:MAG TPA: AI-2E family transporter [Gammaproteobacteria bacterium]|nr:AI-2E family transporter [Gammaproteobacteria bacterium]